ncbi:MAG: PD40 domain-containing protein [Bacteroidaceae bacterium]|nr:PD40 domain-containing protein [Bacteroidaceae bacterium]
MKRLYEYLLVVTLLVCAACSPKAPVVPGGCSAVASKPKIYPDYTDVVIPCNIAPLVFRVEEDGDDFVTRFKAGEKEFVYGGREVSPALDEWRELLAQAAGTAVNVEVYANEAGKWKKYEPFSVIVSADSIDRYISYRLIPPSYVAYEKLTISQRDLTTFDETVIYSNKFVSSEPEGQCINCHAYKNYKTDNMQFHVRQLLGGTVFVHNGKVKKVNLKTDSTISAGVYPFFNPKYDVVAYSVNNTGQIFHTKNPNKVEVQDQASDVIIYDPTREIVSHVANDPDCLEVFPAWSPDGKMLYYCSAYFPKRDDIPHVENMIRNYKDVKYDILRRPWNPETGEFGAVDTVFAASELGKSATFPRVSPCGRYLLFALAEYGCFHIWHKDADLYVMNLATGECGPLEKANSAFPESYHSWSSTGKWILFASRRDDTNYSRLYIAHINDDGTSDKAFLLPQHESEYYDFFDRSYNVPEFMVEPVSITPYEFVDVVKGNAVNVKYSSDFR